MLRVEKGRLVKRNSLELAKAKYLERKMSNSILKKTSVNMVATDPDIYADVCPHKQVHINEGFEESEAGMKQSHQFDYEYNGYTLEITDTVRIVPISKITEHEDKVSSITIKADERLDKKRRRKVSFHQSD